MRHGMHPYSTCYSIDMTDTTTQRALADVTTAAQQVDELKRAFSAALARRDERIAAACQRGASRTQVGEICGINAEQVRRICRRFDVPDGRYKMPANMRENNPERK